MRMGRYLHALNAWRNIASALARGDLHPDDPIALLPHAAEALRQWLAHARSNVPVRPASRESPFDAELYTDASPKGWGAVVVVGGQVHGFGASWGPQDAGKHINILEAIAVQKSVDVFERFLQGTNLRLAIDNRAAAAGVDGRPAKSLELAIECEKAAASVSRVTASWSVCWIASAFNPADEPSRDLPTDPAKALHAVVHGVPLFSSRQRAGWTHVQG